MQTAVMHAPGTPALGSHVEQLMQEPTRSAAIWTEPVGCRLDKLVHHGQQSRQGQAASCASCTLQSCADVLGGGVLHSGLQAAVQFLR